MTIRRQQTEFPLIFEVSKSTKRPASRFLTNSVRDLLSDNINDIFVFKIYKEKVPTVGFEPMDYGMQSQGGNTKAAMAHTRIEVLLAI